MLDYAYGFLSVKENSSDIRRFVRHEDHGTTADAQTEYDDRHFHELYEQFCLLEPPSTTIIN